MSNGRYLLDHFERARIANAAQQQARSDRAEHTGLNSYDHANYLAHEHYDPLIAEWAALWADEYEAEADEDEEDNEDE